VSEDHGRAADALSVGVLAPLGEMARGTTVWGIRRWDEEQTVWARRRSGLLALTDAVFDALRIRPYLETVVVGNLVTTAGWTRWSNLGTAQGGTQGMTSTATRIGAGNGAGTAAAGDTDLSAAAGSANRWFQVISATPTVSTNTITMSATFGTADGNFAWNEMGIDIGTPTVTSGATVNALLWNHKTSIAQGTKASGQTWTATATITFT